MFNNILQSPVLDSVADWISSFVVHQALIAPFLLLFLEESGIPLPVPGDFYVAFVGYQVSHGRITYFEALLFLTIAVLVGSSILFYISSHYAKFLVAKLGRFFDVDPAKMTQVETWFKKYGIWVIIFGRHIPGFRIPITIFSGVSGVSYKTFITGTFISVIFWIALYLYLGETIGKNMLKHLHKANTIYFIVLLIPFTFIILSFLYRKIKGKKTKGKRGKRS